MLTPKQQRFVDEYMVDRNATQAAIRAGYSESSAASIGEENLRKPEIAKAVSDATKAQSKRTLINADRVLAEIAALAFWDPASLVEIMVEVAPGEYKFEGITEPKHIQLLPEEVRRAIVGWSWDRNENFTLKLADKSRALDMLARHLSLYNDKVQVNMLDGLAERLDRARARIDALPVDDDDARQAIEGNSDEP